MTRIIENPTWLKSPAGRYLLAWEQAQLDRVVADIFGFHALQLGRPALDALRANRMPHRWMLNDAPLPSQAGRETRHPGAMPTDAAASVVFRMALAHSTRKLKPSHPASGTYVP